MQANASIRDAPAFQPEGTRRVYPSQPSQILNALRQLRAVLGSDRNRPTAGTSSGPPFNASPLPLQEGDVCRPPGQLEVKLEQPNLKTERTSPEPDQTEPVDLSLNKPRPSSVQASKASATVNPAPGSTQPSLPATPVPSTVQSIGSMVTETHSSNPAGGWGLKRALTPLLWLQVLSPGSILATQGAGGQQILHVIHTIPSVSMPSKVGQLQTIPVVVQSLPVVYTTVPTDGVATAAITVPLIGSDGRSEGSGECRNTTSCLLLLLFLSC